MRGQSRGRTTRRYDLDEAHRLIIRERDGVTGRLRPIRVLEGAVTTDGQNRLLYRTASAAGAAGNPGPQTVAFEGAWRLTPDHALAFTLHETSRQARQTVYLKGAVVAAGANTLTFVLDRGEDEGAAAAQRLVLSGRWRADARNRLTFLIQQADGTEDRLTFQGGWEVGSHHELLYRYRRRREGQRPVDHTLIFGGAWDITRADRLVYRLSGSPDSAFAFKAALQSPSLLARDGRILYQVGIGVSGGKAQPRRVALFGTWKLHRDVSVSFELPYADGRVEAIRFEGRAALSSRDRVAVALRTSRGEPLGVTVTFTRELVPDAELFLRLRQDAEDRSVIGGVQVRF